MNQQILDALLKEAVDIIKVAVVCAAVGVAQHIIQKAAENSVAKQYLS